MAGEEGAAGVRPSSQRKKGENSGTSEGRVLRVGLVAEFKGMSAATLYAEKHSEPLTSLSLVFLGSGTASHTLVWVLAPVRTRVAVQVGRSSPRRRCRRRWWRWEEGVPACGTRQRRQRGRHGREDGTTGRGVGGRGRRGRGTGSWDRGARRRLELVSESQVFLLQADRFVLHSETSQRVSHRERKGQHQATCNRLSSWYLRSRSYTMARMAFNSLACEWTSARACQRE